MVKDENSDTKALYDRSESSSPKREEGNVQLSSDWTNQTVLSVTCASFLLFVVAEVIGAIAGHSWSLLGDAAAMSVDVVSYFTNMVAERIKSKNEGDISPKTQLILEVAIPSFSVIALIGVTIYVTIGAISDIITKPEDDEVDIFMLWLFSSLNAVVDVISAYMFYAKGKEVFYEQFESSSDSGLDYVDSTHNLNTPVNTIGDDQGTVTTGKNLNMISAFTHVGGDTLRTISVFIAACIATWTGIPGYLCDAWAAVVVSVTIVLMVVPLCIEIVGAYGRIQRRALWLKTEPVA